MFPIRFVFLIALCRELVTAQTIPYGKGKVRLQFIHRTQESVSIPYGKGKMSRQPKRLSRQPKYQFPMGKVKFLLNELNPKEKAFVSIPYGKGKDALKITEMLRTHVSIPYGKGKGRNSILRPGTQLTVSIPYGKGKEQHFVLFF